MTIASLRRALAAALVVLTLAGCATPYRQGLVAARQGRYAEASVLYEEALARNPDRLDAIVQLGIVRYKLGALERAIELLERARTRAPAEPSVRLYLALAYLRKNTSCQRRTSSSPHSSVSSPTGESRRKPSARSP